MEYIEHIKYLENIIMTYEHKIIFLKEELISAKFNFQKKCKHEFKLESNDDYHSAKYYNVCQKCNLIK